MKGKIITRKEEQLGNIKVSRIPLVSNKIWWNIPVLRYAHRLYSEPGIIARFALKEQFDIIHAHNSLIYGEAGKQLSRRSNKPFIIEVHALSQEYSAGVLRPIKASYIEWVDRKLLRHCDHVITLTQSLKEWMLNYYKVPLSKITVIPNGADIDQFSPKSEHKLKAEEFRERLGAYGKVVMYAGYMDRLNGIKDLTRVIPQIIRERPSTCFILIGHGPEEKGMIALAKEHPQNVKLLPMAAYSEMPAYYQMCDVFIIPRPSTISSETIIPLKLLEVMAMGKPVLGSNVDGIAEVVKDKENGYLFEKGNLESFKRTLLEVLDADNTRIGSNARKTIVEKYTWDSSVKILQRVYEDIL